MCPTFLDYFRVALSVTVNSVICAIFFRFTGTFQTAQWQDIAAMVVLFTACRSVVTSHLMPDHISDNALRRYGHNTDQETEHRSACTTHTSTAAASMNEAESLTESGPAMNSVEHAHVTDVLYMCDDASLQTERCEMVEETDSIACATASALWSLSTENDPSKIVGVGDDFQHLLDSSTIAIANGMAVADAADSTNKPPKSRFARSLRDDGIISNESFIGAPLPTKTFERENTNGAATTALAATTGTPSPSPLLQLWTKNGSNVAIDDVVKSTTEHIKSFLFGQLPSQPTQLTDSSLLPINGVNDEVMVLGCSPPSPSPSLASTDNDDSQMTDYTVTTVAAADDATTAQPHLLQPKKKVGQRQRQRRNKAIAKAAAAASTAAMQQVGDKGNAQEQNGKMSATGFVPGAMSKVGPMVGSKGQRYQPNPWQRRQSRREEIKQLNEAAAFEAAGDAELCGIQARQEPSDTCDTFSCKNVRGVASDTIVDVTVASQLNGDERDMVHNPSDNTLVPSHIKSGGHFPPELSRQYQAVSRNDDDDCIAVTGEKLDATATLSLDVGDLEETVNTVPMPIHVGKKVRKPRPGKRQRAHRKALLLAALHDQNDPLSMVRTALSLDDPWHYESAAADDDELSVEFQEAESRVAKELLAFLDDQ